MSSPARAGRILFIKKPSTSTFHAESAGKLTCGKSSGHRSALSQYDVVVRATAIRMYESLAFLR
jgi:hypothetical protein